MFEKLRLKFILINMSLLTTVFISIFGTIYFMTNKSLNMEINSTLNILINDNRNHEPKPKLNSNNITVALDKNGNIIKKSTSPNFIVDTDFLQNSIEKVLESKYLSSKLSISNVPYAFLKRTYSMGTKIVFLDISYEEDFKISLLKIFISVGGISLVILFIISIYLTNKSIKPIKDVFEKQK